MFDICICTYQPDLETLEKVVKSVALQNVDKTLYKVIIIDNGSWPSLSAEDKVWDSLRFNNVIFKVYQEPKVGVAHARILALKLSILDMRTKFILFVDDDNILDKDYLANAFSILRNYPEVGCFSGKLTPSSDLHIPEWIGPFRISLALRNCGERIRIDFFKGEWAEWVPTAAAGMVIRKQVGAEFIERNASRKEFQKFGRVGRSGLKSGEDYLLALSAAQVGFSCGYFPDLNLVHQIRPDRLSFWYISRLMLSYALTDLMMIDYLDLAPKRMAWSELKHRCLGVDHKDASIKTKICFLIYQYTYVMGVLYRVAKSGRFPIGNDKRLG